MSIVSHDSYDSSPPRGGSELTWTRIYFPHGKLAHYREAGSTCPVILRAYDLYVDLTPALGTGTQDEHDTAAAMPLCRDCWAVREMYANHPDPRLGRGHGVEMT